MGCCDSKEGDWADDDKQMIIEENRIEGTINYKVDDYRFVEMQKWPVILLDTTGSMNLQCEKNDPKLRSQLVYETIWQVAQYLIPYNTVDEDGNQRVLSPQQALLLKGIPLITFNAMEGGTDRGLFHPSNFVNEWSNIRFHGGTHIMDGWRKMLQAYENRFNDLPQPQWPLLLALLITDGELQDGQEFEQHLKHVKGRMFVEIAVVGFGEDHDNALKHYKKIAKAHDHVRVTSFTDHTDPIILCKQLISLIDPKCIQQINSDQLIPPSLQNLNTMNTMPMINNPNVQPMVNANQFVPNNMGYYNNPNVPVVNNNVNNGFYNNSNGPTAPFNPNY